MRNKLLVATVLLLLLGVAVAPSINSSVVKTSDNDLVEVTSQACGIKGFGDTTVKLTKQQYRDLEHYLVDFRAKLNRTTTREEAIPLFKDAVVELNKYGLLPKGMSVERAQRLVIGGYQNERLINSINKLHNLNQNNINSNILCLVAGALDYTYVIHRFNIWLIYACMYLFFSSFHNWYINGTNPLLFLLACGLVFTSGLLNFFADLNPIALFDVFGIGIRQANDLIKYSSGWLKSLGLLGVKSWNGSLFGTLPGLELPVEPMVIESFPAMWGFCGIKITPDASSGKKFFLGSAFVISVDNKQ